LSLTFDIEASIVLIDVIAMLGVGVREIWTYMCVLGVYMSEKEYEHC